MCLYLTGTIIVLAPWRLIHFFASNITVSIKLKTPATAGVRIFIEQQNQIASATTSVTSGTIRFNNPSMPAFKVIMEEGQPLQEPWSINSTFPS